MHHYLFYVESLIFASAEKTLVLLLLARGRHAWRAILGVFFREYLLGSSFCDLPDLYLSFVLE